MENNPTPSSVFFQFGNIKVSLQHLSNSQKLWHDLRFRGPVDKNGDLDMEKLKSIPGGAVLVLTKDIKSFQDFYNVDYDYSFFEIGGIGGINLFIRFNGLKRPDHDIVFNFDLTNSLVRTFLMILHTTQHLFIHGPSGQPENALSLKIDNYEQLSRMEKALRGESLLGKITRQKPTPVDLPSKQKWWQFWK